MKFLDKWNKSKFNVYESEEKTVLKIVSNINNFIGELSKGLDNKTDNTGNHLGSWQGINRPTLSDEGMRGTVELIKKETDYQKFNSINMLNFDGVDDTEKLQNAINSNYAEIIIPNIELTRPITIPFNRGVRLKGIGGLKRSAIRVRTDNTYSNRAILELLTNENKEPNYAGITLEDLHLIGNDSLISAIHLQYSCYPYFKNVLIEGFRGHGLLLDKCQDGSFNNLIIQNCGLSTGDGTINSETTKAPLEFITTISDDHNNMLRFNDIQIEQNKVSPYIRFKDTGSIGIWFDKCHFEIRESIFYNKHDLFESFGGDIEFNNINVSPTFRNGFIYDGYGSLKFTNCRSLNNIINKGDGVNNSISFINCEAKNVNLLSSNGVNNFISSKFENINFNYPSGFYNVKDCNVDTIVLDYKGSFPKIYIDNVNGRNIYYNSTASGLILKNSHFTNTLKFEGVEGECVNNTCNGSFTVNKSDNKFVKAIKISYDIKTPLYGYWYLGDIIYNENPISSSNVGWVCIESGTPGIWKKFGTIEN